MTKRNWILGFFIAAAGFGLLGTIFLLVPRQPAPMVVGQPQSFRFVFDPHLFLKVDEASFQASTAESSMVLLDVVASNTAAGDMEIDLSNLRLALVAEDGESLHHLAPVWKKGRTVSTSLPPRTSLSAEVELLVPNGVRPVAIVIWKDFSFLRFLPAARGTALCPTLRLDLDQLGGTAQPLH